MAAGQPRPKRQPPDWATTEQLLVLANLESHNAQMIADGLRQDLRLDKLNEIAIWQMSVLAAQDAPLRALGGDER